MNKCTKMGLKSIFNLALMLVAFGLVSCGGSNPPQPPNFNTPPTNQPFSPNSGFGGGSCGVGTTGYGYNNQSVLSAFATLFDIGGYGNQNGQQSQQTEMSVQMQLGYAVVGDPRIPVTVNGSLLYQGVTFCVSTNAYSNTGTQSSRPSYYAPSDSSIDWTLRGFSSSGQYGQIPIEVRIGHVDCGGAWIFQNGRMQGCVDVLTGYSGFQQSVRRFMMQ